MLSLCPYTLEEQQGLIKKVIEDAEIQQTLIASIEASSFEVQNVLKTPLMVILYIKQYQVGFSVPKHVTDFYRNIFEVVTRVHDRSKGIEKRQSFSSLNQEQLERVFERVCFESFLLGETVFERPLFIQILKKSLEKNKISIDLDFNLIIDDFTRFACLILKDGTHFTFIHKSIQEYYVAKFISELPEATAKQVIKKKIISSFSYVENIKNFLEITRPYFYKKYYLLEDLLKYENLLNLKFTEEEVNYKAFIETLFIYIDDSEGNIKRSLAVPIGISKVIDKFSGHLLQNLSQKLVNKGITNQELIANIVIDFNDTFKSNIASLFSTFQFEDLIKSLDDPEISQLTQNIWSKICSKVDQIKEEVHQYESSVLDDELDLADI